MKLTGIWDDDYACRLGILDHCHELITLNDEIVRQKANGSETCQEQFYKECADLYLILANYLHTTLQPNALLETRLTRFIEKSKGEELA